MRTVYNIDDLFDMNELLDVEEHMAAKAMEEAERGGRPGR
jgi:hypothetical protein